MPAMTRAHLCALTKKREAREKWSIIRQDF